MAASETRADHPVADIAVVGAGAAGLMAAIAAARYQSVSGQALLSPLRVLLIDTRERIGAKILISGGTRCNVTNVRVEPSDYQGGPRHFVKHVLEAFTPSQTRQFFSEIGVELVLEPTGKYFPTTHSGKTVLEALMKEAARLGVELKTGTRITQLGRGDGHFDLGDEQKNFFRAQRVVLATGGLSYPETGSDGTGLTIAESLGHKLLPRYPALTPLLTDDEQWKSLSGITLETRLNCFINHKKAAESRGSFLFTHAGFSGPAALDISRHVAASLETHPAIEASFVPDENEAGLRRRLEEYAAKYPARAVKTFLVEHCGLPVRLAEVFAKKMSLDASLPARRLTAIQKGRLAHALLHCPLSVTGVAGYKKAEVTAGGVALSEVHVASMESRRVRGLYFAGEILDVDGRIGGFNFQWAWSTGAIAGKSAAKSLGV